ncbi:TPA: hypothetical protein QCX59_004033 [Bacillus mycoides]|nr:hypothetical protein [Bacillus mycoides]
MNEGDINSQISRLKEEIKNVWKIIWLMSIMATFLWFFLEPTMKSMFKSTFPEEDFNITIIQVCDYASVVLVYIGYIVGLIAILKKKRAIRRYKKTKDVPSKINIQKDDINQNPVYVIDHSKDTLNQYEKGDRDMMKRVFNQNKSVPSNPNRKTTSRAKLRASTNIKESAIRNYNGSTRSPNNTESNDIALGVALESSTYSTGQDNDCSSSNNSGYSSSSSDSSSDGGSSCD